jgi:hypothetical protein
MRTTILARVIALVGLVTIVLGAWNVIIETPRFPLIDFSIAVGIVAGGFGLMMAVVATRLYGSTAEAAARYGSRWRSCRRARFRRLYGPRFLFAGQRMPVVLSFV